MDAPTARDLSSAVSLQRLRVRTTRGQRVGRVFDVRTTWTPGDPDPLRVEQVLVGRSGWMERVGLRPRHLDTVSWTDVVHCADCVLVVDHEAWERRRA
jgi:sporulation protein YlmC with PRC-barrel domain